MPMCREESKISHTTLCLLLSIGVSVAVWTESRSKVISKLKFPGKRHSSPEFLLRFSPDIDILAG